MSRAASRPMTVAEAEAYVRTCADRLDAIDRDKMQAAEELRNAWRALDEAKGRGSSFCPACGAAMYPARLLKGYDKTGPDAERPTCALHGPQGRFRHIATDR